MKPHKHAELIKAWADGAEIQQRHLINNIPTNWYEFADDWNCEISEFRIKPEPKPDVVTLEHLELYYFQNSQKPTVIGDRAKIPNVLFRFDGETGELKSAEVLK